MGEREWRPERIHVLPPDRSGPAMLTSPDFPSAVAYVRADLLTAAEARVAALEAEVKRLRARCGAGAATLRTWVAVEVEENPHRHWLEKRLDLAADLMREVADGLDRDTPEAMRQALADSARAALTDAPKETSDASDEP
jgi:hypothetical protein